MMLATGSYRLRSDPNPPGTPDMKIKIQFGPSGMSTCGEWIFDSGKDWYSLDGDPARVILRFLDATHFVAIVNPGMGPPKEHQYTGTYAPEP